MKENEKLQSQIKNLTFFELDRKQTKIKSN